MNNKVIVFALVMATSCLTFGSCSSSEAVKGSEKTQVSAEQNLSLGDWLRRLNAVTIRGSRVAVRGSMDIDDPNKPPLFVINGNVIGRSFSAAKQLAPRGTILSVKVLTPSQAAMYGSRGAAGVIIIETE